MDKTKLIKIIQSTPINAVTIPSTASKGERENLIKSFNRSVSLAQTGEVILIVIQK